MITPVDKHKRSESGSVRPTNSEEGFIDMMQIKNKNTNSRTIIESKKESMAESFVTSHSSDQVINEE